MDIKLSTILEYANIGVCHMIDVFEKTGDNPEQVKRLGEIGAEISKMMLMVQNNPGVTSWTIN